MRSASAPTIRPTVIQAKEPRRQRGCTDRSFPSGLSVQCFSAVPSRSYRRSCRQRRRPACSHKPPTARRPAQKSRSPESAWRERFTADQPAVEQRDAVNRHKQHQRGANHHKALSALSATAGAAIASPGRRANAPRPVFIVAIFIVSFPITVWSESYSAASSDSPVRMRITRCSSATKILPSPIFPVYAALLMTSTTSSS